LPTIQAPSSPAFSAIWRAGERSARRHYGKEDSHVAARLPFSSSLRGRASPEPRAEVKRAILARWASDRSAIKDKPALRRSPGARRAVPVDEVFAALRALDDSPGQSGARA